MELRQEEVRSEEGGKEKRQEVREYGEEMQLAMWNEECLLGQGKKNFAGLELEMPLLGN